jgi:hypothetical protein
VWRCARAPLALRLGNDGIGGGCDARQITLHPLLQCPNHRTGPHLSAELDPELDDEGRKELEEDKRQFETDKRKFGPLHRDYDGDENTPFNYPVPGEKPFVPDWTRTHADTPVAGLAPMRYMRYPSVRWCVLSVDAKSVGALRVWRATCADTEKMSAHAAHYLNAQRAARPSRFSIATYVSNI